MMNWMFFSGKPLDAAAAMRGPRIRDAPIPAETNSRREILTMLKRARFATFPERAYLQGVRKPRPMDSAARGRSPWDGGFSAPKTSHSAEGASRLSYHVVLSEAGYLFVIVR